MKVAIDVHGGDRAPNEVLKGVLEAAKEVPPDSLILVGKPELIQNTLGKEGKHFPIVEAQEVISMEEPPVRAVLKKRKSTITIGIQLVQKGEADAFISAGSTGAVVAAAQLYLKNLVGIKRAGIASPYVSEKGHCLIIDAGANVNCRPIHLLQYAFMAKVYGQFAFGWTNPTIGLMNIGEESTKGNELVKETYRLLRASSLNFIGNIEGQDLAKGVCDIVLCDGFVGNVILKLTEGLASSLLAMACQEVLDKTASNSQGTDKQIQGAFGEVSKKLDYEEYGAAPLLGVRGICLICHGRSSYRSIQNAIRLAFQLKGVNEQIAQEIEQMQIPL
ncbi:MAG: phosphate acyltransferase PlsX [Planctomycetota bacterium]|nr:MAG: phosphate acyltransferase PlsX [Planctomycetota bacterium]